MLTRSIYFLWLNQEVKKKFTYTIFVHSVDYSLFRSKSWNGLSPNLNARRWISSGELSSVLRPFYFAVHPDLFGQHPQQRVNQEISFFWISEKNNYFYDWQTTNEESLKHLSAYLEGLQNQRIPGTSPKHINFYVRDQKARGAFFHRFLQKSILHVLWLLMRNWHRFFPFVNRFIQTDSNTTRTWTRCKAFLEAYIGVMQFINGNGGKIENQKSIIKYKIPFGSQCLHTIGWFDLRGIRSVS